MNEDRSPRGRFGWLAEEEEEEEEEETPRGQEAPVEGEDARFLAQGTSASRSPRAGVMPGVSQGSGALRGRRRRSRPKDPNALRNDPSRMIASARIPRDLRRRVDQALADPALAAGAEGGTNFSLLVEALLERWLEEVGYPWSNTTSP